MHHSIQLYTKSPVYSQTNIKFYAQIVSRCKFVTCWNNILTYYFLKWLRFIIVWCYNSTVPSTFSGGTGHMFSCEDEPPDFEWSRLNELQRRNTLCLPHLKTSYPVETQRCTSKNFNDDKLQKSQYTSSSNFLTDSGRKRKNSSKSDLENRPDGDVKQVKRPKTIHTIVWCFLQAHHWIMMSFFAYSLSVVLNTQICLLRSFSLWRIVIIWTRQQIIEHWAVRITWTLFLMFLSFGIATITTTFHQVFFRILINLIMDHKAGHYPLMNLMSHISMSLCGYSNHNFHEIWIKY